MVIPPWIINPYGDIEETNVIIQEELTELSINEELKVQFKNGYQQFWLKNNIPVTYPVLWNICRLKNSPTSTRHYDYLQKKLGIEYVYSNERLNVKNS
ncbi:unnamed protein product [Acanthoscelides obtectus]|uniref:Uncharacterized protein n=1 Tax=Acanthoscelides obtectus TaxID=200917 RepID=A0A9P0QG91_ACAOB|nr:unnamed protein product [Acanthoscelides obtectus]CAK1682844.1 hypothetical protein AOBTE_LOCUS33926 [Acanthoscelides obtectus]